MATGGVNATVIRCLHSGDLETLHKLSEIAPKVVPMLNKHKDSFGNTSLHIAVANNHLEIVKYLVEKVKVDVNEPNTYGWNAIMLASYHRHFNIAVYFLQNGYLKSINHCNSFGLTALHVAVAKNDIQIARLLIGYGANPNFRGGTTSCNSLTCLMLACQRGSVNMIGLLLENGAELNAQSSPNSWTALMFVAIRSDFQNSSRMAKLLLEYGADVYVKSRFGKSCLDLAKECNNKQFLEIMDVEDDSITDTEISKKVEEPTVAEKHPIFNAIHNKNRPLLLSLLSNDKSCVLEIDPETGNTPLTLAALKGDHTSLKILLDCGAPVDAENLVCGWTPLMYAVYLNRLDMAKMLLDCGASETTEGRLYDDSTGTPTAKDECVAVMSVRDMARVNGLNDMLHLLDYYKEQNKKQETSRISPKGILKGCFDKLRRNFRKTFSSQGSSDSSSSLPRRNSSPMRGMKKKKQVMVDPFADLEHAVPDRSQQFYVPTFDNCLENDSSFKANPAGSRMNDANFPKSPSAVSSSWKNSGYLSVSGENMLRELESSLDSTGRYAKISANPRSGPSILPSAYNGIPSRQSASTLNSQLFEEENMNLSDSGSTTAGTRVRHALNGKSGSQSRWEKYGSILIPKDVKELLNLAYGAKEDLKISQYYHSMKDIPLDQILNVKQESELLGMGVSDDRERAKLYVTIVKVRGEIMKRNLESARFT